VAEWSRVARRIRVPLGFAFAVVYLWIAHPTWASIGIGLVIALPGLLLRALASGYVKKNEELTTSGPYAYTRNPLYLGSLVIAVGFAAAARSVWVLVLTVVMFLVIYLPVIRSEESFLRKTFPTFEEYALRVPRLLPRLRPFASGKATFSIRLYWQHREYNAILGTAAVMAGLVAKRISGLH
jgi:protein-S-isoprenylcysteine O-methyltransferase Ste14